MRLLYSCAMLVLKMETVRLPSVCNKYVHRLDFLCVRGRCLKTGYTKHMLNMIRVQRVIFMKGKLKLIGNAN